MKTAIVVVAFNRPANLAKLLNSLAGADFETSDVPLVISIDYTDSSEHEEVVRTAASFEWQHGEKLIIEHKKNLGIRDHILSCGDLTARFDAVIILEDDLRVSPSFYRYATQAAVYYQHEDRIAGISLYAYEFDEIGWFTLYPRSIGSDTYFMQWAASWGQLWTRNQWNAFKAWYHPDREISAINIPDTVKRWKHSWKKYYIAYLVDQNRYFAYPYRSYTTLLDEKGVHNPYDSRINNVPLAEHRVKRPFLFSATTHNELKYDCFFQPITQPVYVPSMGRSVEVAFDLFGTKPLHLVTAAYLCSIKPCTNPVFSYSNKLIPYELNWEQAEQGTYFHLGRKEDFSDQMPFLHEGNKLYAARKIFRMKEMFTVVLSRVVGKYLKPTTTHR